MTTKRRKTLRGILLGCLLGLLSVGCSQEQSAGKPEQPAEPAKVQAVTFEVRTGLETYSVPSQTYEKKINSCRRSSSTPAGRWRSSPYRRQSPG